ncbi:MAG: CTP synthase [Oscillospiraceae bacterium]|nr:CTP synthase [Oscillospiraceae bacterium]
MATKYIFVTGGVVSGLGKGITAASLGRLLKCRGFKVTIQKCDPYINFDPGTMSPYQHGEVFVTDDGAETDLDLGHYERFVDENLNSNSNVTSGKVYYNVINKERRGDYLGGTVQVIPHITNEIKEHIYFAGKDNNVDFVITEIGGTVGDIESLPFLESIRQVQWDVGRDNCIYIHVSLVPYIASSGEQKSKPTQHSVKELLGLGIQPDIIVCRTETPLEKGLKEKIASFCNVHKDCVVENLDAPTLYAVPLALEEGGLAKAVLKCLNIPDPGVDLSEWTDMVNTVLDLGKDGRKVKIALVGKYVALHDAYLSVAEALRHGGIANKIDVEIDWTDSEEITAENAAERLKDADGILVPGGFGDRGIEGKIQAVRYARENNIPFFGICLGMQMAVVEFARDVLGYDDADSSEFSPESAHTVIHIMPDQKNVENMGGTLRLGLYPCKLGEGSRIGEIYGGEPLIYERHRHRYEYNNEYRDALTEAGLAIGGLSPDNRLVETVEIKAHPWFVGVQFHPEFKSRPNRAHPLFASFIKAAGERAEKK